MTTLITEHEHYPQTPEEGRELYDDLMDFADLTHKEALETVGYEASRQIWSFDKTGPLAKFIIVTDAHAYPADLDRDRSDLAVYMAGAALGADDRRVQYV